MGLFVMEGKYSLEAVANVSAERTQKAAEIVQQYNGSIKSIYALLGNKDLLIIAEFPDVNSAMKASVVFNREFKISFSTYPAVKVEDFDRMMAE